MDYVKVHTAAIQKIKRSKKVITSNPCSVDVSICEVTRNLIIDGQVYDSGDIKHYSFEDYKIYNIDDKHHLLTFTWHTYDPEYIYLIILDDENKIIKLEGKVQYISNTGFIYSYFDPSDATANYQHFDVTTLKSESSCKFHWKKILLVFKYIVVVRTDSKLFDFYVPKKIWLDDFQKSNPGISIEPYFMVKPNYRVELTTISVHFKDCTKRILSSELVILRSEFVNEQLSQGDVYFDTFTFDEYQSEKFLIFIKSFRLNMILKNCMRKYLEDQIK